MFTFLSIIIHCASDWNLPSNQSQFPLKLLTKASDLGSSPTSLHLKEHLVKYSHQKTGSNNIEN